jgi:hypothetical protein
MGFSAGATKGQSPLVWENGAGQIWRRGFSERKKKPLAGRGFVTVFCLPAAT